MCDGVTCDTPIYKCLYEPLCLFCECPRTPVSVQPPGPSAQQHTLSKCALQVNRFHLSVWYLKHQGGCPLPWIASMFTLKCLSWPLPGLSKFPHENPTQWAGITLLDVVSIPQKGSVNSFQTSYFVIYLILNGSSSHGRQDPCGPAPWRS